MESSSMQLWASMATLVTAVAALLMILEMRWQRHSGYRPDLIVSGESFQMRGNDRGALEVVGESTEGRESIASRSRPAVQCANVGVAHAKDVRIEWDYDILAFIAVIAELDGELGRSIVLEQPLLHFEGRSRHSVHMVQTQAAARMASIAPGPISGATRLSVPSAYLELLCAYFGAIVERLQRSKAGPDTAPIALRLVVRYRDIGNNRHSKRFLILPKFSSIRTGVSGGDGTQTLAEVQGYFEVQEA